MKIGNFHMTLEEILKKYSGKDNYGKPKSAFIEMLNQADDAEIEQQCKDYIWLSAYAANNPRSDYHWKADACYDVCQMKDKLEIYQRAYTKISEST